MLYFSNITNFNIIVLSPEKRNFKLMKNDYDEKKYSHFYIRISGNFQEVAQETF
jgi:hypothetical protein